jgi:hypothetical protein
MTKWPSQITALDKKEMLERWIRELSDVSESISPISDMDKSRKEGLSELVNYLKGELADLER